MRSIIKLIVCVAAYYGASRLWQSFQAGYICGSIVMAVLMLIDRVSLKTE